MKTISKLVSSSLMVGVLLCHCFTTSHAFYFNQDEQLEQKYESSSNDADNYLSGNGDKSSSASSDYNQELKPYSSGNSRLLGMFGGSSGGGLSSLDNFKSPVQSLKDMSYDSKASSSDQYGSLKSITSIPSGSMFSMGGPGDQGNQLQFESPFSKQPYSIVFRTQSMPVKIKQQHHTMPAPEVEFVRSQEEAHRIQHEVIRPVIQEVHEIIQPYRRVVQEVRPVIENVHTIVAKGDSRGGNGSAGSGGSGGQQGQQQGGNGGGRRNGGHSVGHNMARSNGGGQGGGGYPGNSYAASESRPRISPNHQNHRFSQGVAQSQYKPSQFADSYYRHY